MSCPSCAERRGGKAAKNVARMGVRCRGPSLFLSTITILEQETGVLLAAGRDRTQGAVLRAGLEDHVLAAFSQRILPVDVAVAQRAAKLQVSGPALGP